MALFEQEVLRVCEHVVESRDVTEPNGIPRTSQNSRVVVVLGGKNCSLSEWRHGNFGTHLPLASRARSESSSSTG